MWYPYDDGKTISTKGSEEGVIILDEEFSNEARITLEKDGWTPYAITCGIYGMMAHTAFASTETEAVEKYSSMKKEIQDFCEGSGDSSDWCCQFTGKYH